MTLSTHVLDTARGGPAAGVPVALQRPAQPDWLTVARGSTDADGRLSRWTPEVALEAGRYRLLFDVAAYLGPDAFFPEVTVVFDIADPSGKLHLPLLLSPFGYTAYRGV
jgi:5-hydroxyisourate hydrolase